MSTDCYCEEHRNYFECTTMYDGKPNFPVPAIPLEVCWWPRCHVVGIYDRITEECVVEYDCPPANCRCEVCRFWA